MPWVGAARTETVRAPETGTRLRKKAAKPGQRVGELTRESSALKERVTHLALVGAVLADRPRTAEVAGLPDRLPPRPVRSVGLQSAVIANIHRCGVVGTIA